MGYDYAWALASKAEEWESARLPGAQAELTRAELVEDVAAEQGVSVVAIRVGIWRARTELFGRVTDQAISHALIRDAEIADRASQVCKAFGCTNELPADRRSSRQFCSPRCRVRFHRQ